MVPPSCGTILKAVDLALGSRSGLSAASPWVKVMGRVVLGEMHKLRGGSGVVSSLTTDHAEYCFFGHMTKTSEQEGT